MFAPKGSWVGPVYSQCWSKQSLLKNIYSVQHWIVSVDWRWQSWATVRVEGLGYRDIVCWMETTEKSKKERKENMRYHRRHCWSVQKAKGGECSNVTEPKWRRARIDLVEHRTFNLFSQTFTIWMPLTSSNLNELYEVQFEYVLATMNYSLWSRCLCDYGLNSISSIDHLIRSQWRVL